MGEDRAVALFVISACDACAAVVSILPSVVRLVVDESELHAYPIKVVLAECVRKRALGLVARLSSSGVVVLAAHVDDRAERHALRAGASFVHRLPVEEALFVARVRALARLSPVSGPRNSLDRANGLGQPAALAKLLQQKPNVFVAAEELLEELGTTPSGLRRVMRRLRLALGDDASHVKTKHGFGVGWFD
jgi:DNA-binding response OmpR family regulator